MSLTVFYSHRGQCGAQLPTYIRDASGRLVAYRSDLPDWILKCLDEVGKKAETLVRKTYLSEGERLRNKRGGHYFSIFGQDRQNKTVIIKYTSFDRDHMLTTLMMTLGNHAFGLPRCQQAW